MKVQKDKVLTAIILVTSLFFLWGFAHSILDVLNKHFQSVLVITKAHSAMVQMVVYGGYFLMALPAGAFLQKYSYRKGIVLGLVLYSLGALLFIPAERVMSFEYFLFCLFIIGCGLTFLETAANPYITELGSKEQASSRLNLAQSFNGLGWIVGPMVGGLLVFQADGTSGSIALPYTVIGIVVLIIAVVFLFIPLPKGRLEADEQQNNMAERFNGSVWSHPLFKFGVIAQLAYVGAQTGINSFFINYLIEEIPDMTPRIAALLLSVGSMGLFMTGRFLGSYLMRSIPAAVLLRWAALGALFCMILVIASLSYISVVALILCYLFESIMFPTIFALSIDGLGKKTKQGSSFLIMSIVGGAITPFVMGLIGETKMAIGFVIPLVCFIAVLWFSQKVIKSKKLSA